MPTNALVENTFGQGLITEATGLNFPKDACTDTYNCVFNQKMSVNRRLGFNYETGYETDAAQLSDNVIREYLWKNVAGLGTINFVVVQIGNILSFYNTSSSASLSSGRKAFTVDLNTLKVAGSPNTNTEYADFTDGNGYLFVFHPYCDPIYIKYTVDTDTIETFQSTLQIRDFEGVEDNLGVEERPGVLSMEHKYNLYNQGWYIVAKCTPSGSVTRDDSTRQNVLAFWDSQRSDYPSNADYWWAWKSVFNAFSEFEVDKYAIGNSPAPKGHYLLNAFYQDRNAATEEVVGSGGGLGPEGDGTSGGVFTPSTPVTGLPVNSASYFRPSTGAFFAGRVFYAGVNYGKFSNKIYFSRIVEKDPHIAQCYQDNDPTSEENSDLLPSDGGVIISQEIGTVYKLFPVGFSLIIFASNGVWSISGSQGTGFTANDYSIAKLSSTGILTGTSFVDIDGAPVWWNLNGVYILGPSGSTDAGTLKSAEVQSLTDGTIKAFINEIPADCKKHVKGTYDRKRNTVFWLYRSTVPTTIQSRYEYDRVLCFNTLTRAFFPWTLPPQIEGNVFNNADELVYDEDDDIVTVFSGSAIAGVIAIQGQGNTVTVENLYTLSGEVVYTLADELIQVNVSTVTEISSVVKYLTHLDNGTITWSEEFDTSYLDFSTLDYSSYFDTGYVMAGQGIAKFQTPYLLVYLTTPPAQATSLDVFNKWDFSRSGNTGKWSSVQRINFSSELETYKTKRLKMRGRGRSLQMRMQSITGIPFEIIGWSVLLGTS